MAAVENIHAQLLGQRVSPVRTFASNEGVHAFGGGRRQITTGTTGDDADATAYFLSAGNEFRFGPGGALQFLGEFNAGNFPTCLQTDGLPVAGKKWLQIFQAQRGGELRVVAKPGMRIQRQVRTVNGQIVFDEQPEQFITLAGPRMRFGPEQAVMNDEQVRPRGNGHGHGGKTGVHGRSEARDGAGIFHLQAIDRAVVIAEGGGAENFIAMTDDGSKLDFRHDAMKANHSQTARRESIGQGPNSEHGSATRSAFAKADVFASGGEGAGIFGRGCGSQTRAAFSNGTPPDIAHRRRDSMVHGHRLVEIHGVPAVSRTFFPHHGLAQDLIDIEGLPVEPITGFELAIHFVRKVMESAVEIIFVTQHNYKISRGTCGMSHRNLKQP